MTPFRPVGERARWRIIFDLLAGMQPGEVLTYEDAAEAVGLDPVADLAVLQAAFRRAGQENEVTNRRAIEAVPRIGYRVVTADEHERLARKYQGRSIVALQSGRSKVSNVRLDELSAEGRAVIEAMGLAFSRQADAIRGLDIRQRNLEDALTATTQTANRTQEEVAEMRSRMAALEERLRRSDGGV